MFLPPAFEISLIVEASFCLSRLWRDKAENMNQICADPKRNEKSQCRVALNKLQALESHLVLNSLWFLKPAVSRSLSVLCWV